MTTAAPRTAKVIRRWPLWLGSLLVAASTTVLVALFVTSADTSERALAQRDALAATTLNWRELQAGVRAIEQDTASGILARDPGALRRVAGRAVVLRDRTVSLDPTLAPAARRFARRLGDLSALATAGDWRGASDRQLRLSANDELGAQLERGAARTRQRWRSADRSTSPFDQRSTAFPQVVALTGLLLVLGAALLGAVASRALTQQRRARRRAEEESDRAVALESAVGARTVELVEANAQLEREMTERGAAEAKLRQGQKMEAIGQLTGGIAHDFNNMLAVVVGGIELARRRAGEPAQVARHLDRAMEGCERAVALIRRLLSFARAEPANATPLSLNATIEGIADMLERTLGERIMIDLALADALPPVVIDRSQLENAILNLAVNARDAMPDGGTLTLTTARIESEVELAVTDTGAGMDDAVRERALEPFFTTKMAGQGTGLGLSQIFGMVTAADGQMTIDSGVGEGTTIRIRLPATLAEDEETAAGSRTTEVPGPATPRTILVVEDDSRVRRATVSALEELGHRALACSDGSAALALVRGGAGVDLVVSDVVMPGLSGPDLARALERGGMSRPILFVTGYAATEHADVLARYELLRKPFTLPQLAAALGRAQDRVIAPRHAEAEREAATALQGPARDAATA